MLKSKNQVIKKTIHMLRKKFENIMLRITTKF